MILLHRSRAWNQADYTNHLIYLASQKLQVFSQLPLETSNSPC